MQTLNNKIAHRLNWVDALRGLAMLLVVYGHQVGGNDQWLDFFIWTSPIKIPLFFIISGFVFNSEKEAFPEFIKHLWNRLIIPWLALSLIPVICLSPMKGLSYLSASIVQVFTGGIAWFMPCLIISQLIFYFIVKNIKNYVVLGGISLAFTCLGQFLRMHSPAFHVLMFDVALTMLLFLYFGKLLRKYQQWMSIRVSVPICMLALYCLLIILSYHFFPGSCMDVHQGEYYSYVICLLLSLSGCFVLFYFFSHIRKFCKGILIVGTNTLVIYLWHNYFAYMFEKLFKLSSITIDYRVSGLIITLLATAICCVISIQFSKYLPFINGTKRRNQ